MKATPVTFALTLAAGAAAAAPITHLTREQPIPAACSVTVEFVSICCGPDRELEERITLAVIAERRVKAAWSRPWGEEGESTLCLVTRSRADARALARLYKAWAAASLDPILTTVKLGGPARPPQR